MSVNAAKEIDSAVAVFKEILETYQDSGDWYHCVSHAVEYLEEAAASMPPTEPQEQSE